MSTIKKLKLKLKSGLLSELQSDTILGHFCWRMKEQLGDNKLAGFISLYQGNNPVFTLSDGILEKDNIVFFKKPYINTEFKPETKSKKERIANFLRQKEIKTRAYVTLEQLNLFLNGDLETYEKSFELPEIKTLSVPQLKQDLRISVEIDRETMSSKKERLFSYNPSYVEDKDDNTFIVIFIKIIDEKKYYEFDCESILKSIFEVGFGKKKSSGYGQFEVIGEVEKFEGFKELKDSTGFITLGNLLKGKNDNIENAYFEYNVKYGKLGEAYSRSENPFKKPIIFFTTGSCFCTSKGSEYYGRVTEDGEVSPANNFVVQFGMPFTLNFSFIDNN